MDWGGHTPHLPEGVPEIDADPLSLDGHCREEGQRRHEA